MNYDGEYTDEEISHITTNLVNTIMEIKSKAKVTRVKPDVVNLSDAGEICNIGANANLVKQIQLLQKNVDEANQFDDLLSKHGDKLMIMAMSLAAVLITAIVMKYVYGS